MIGAAFFPIELIVFSVVFPLDRRSQGRFHNAVVGLAGVLEREQVIVDFLKLSRRRPVQTLRVIVDGFLGFGESS